jgi:hypothetical protein
LFADHFRELTKWSENFWSSEYHDACFFGRVVTKVTVEKSTVNPRPLFVGIVETTKSKIRYDERQRHWLEVVEY